MNKKKKQKEHLRRLEALKPYVREIGDLMRLRHWEIKLDSEIAPDDCAARTMPIFGRLVGRIEIGSSFWDESPESQRQIIVHELLHLHFAPMTNAVLEHLEGLVNTFFTQSMEYGVDISADLIALSMPLPPALK